MGAYVKFSSTGGALIRRGRLFEGVGSLTRGLTVLRYFHLTLFVNDSIATYHRALVKSFPGALQSRTLSGMSWVLQMKKKSFILT